MHKSRTRGRGLNATARLLLLLALMAAALTIVAGCGSDDEGDSGSGSGESSSASSDGVAEARQMVEESLKPPQVKVAGKPFDAGKAKGKTVWFNNTCDCNVVANIWRDAMIKALEPYGVKVVNFDGKGSVTEYNRGMQQAIAQKADAILNMGITPQSIREQVAAAADAGIPVISTTDGDPELKKNRAYVPGLAAEVSYDYIRVGSLEAAWAIADSDGKANALFISNLDQPSSYYVQKGFKDTMERLCPDCEVSTVDVPAALAAKQLPGLARSTLARDPSIDYIVPGYDLNVSAILSSLRLADLESDVKVGSWNAIPPVMVALKDEDTPMAMEMGAPNSWMGHAMADASLRAIVGAPTATQGGPDSNYLGIRMFTKDSVQPLDVTKYNDQELYDLSDAQIQAAFEKVWGAPAGQ